MTSDKNHGTKQRLLDVGMAMLLRQGYNDLGIQALLAATGVPKGSFYHHFRDKKDFALQAIDQYMDGVHAALDASLTDETLTPLVKARRFFEMTEQAYRQEGYLGCLLGGLGQELSGVSEDFRSQIDRCLSEIALRLAGCLESARERGDIPAHTNTRRMAFLLVDCWEGAALRSRLEGSPEPLFEMLDFYFTAMGMTGTTEWMPPSGATGSSLAPGAAAESKPATGG